MRTLWIEASPNLERSLSSACAEEWLEAAGAEAVGEVERFNVWDYDFVAVEREIAIAKFAPLFGEKRTDEQKAQWARVKGEIERVRGFDRLLISSPMWNWSIPHALKAWIDVLVQPIHSFTLNEQGEHVGALGDGRPCQLILTRSSQYEGGAPELVDFQRPYLEYLFGPMLGYEVSTLVVEPTTRWTPEERAQMRSDALAAARASAPAGAKIRE